MDPRITPVPLPHAHDEGMFGGKAVSLGAALRAGLPVPPGAAVAAHLVDAVAAGNEAAISTVLSSPHIPQGRVAVRSSAVGEDSAGSSFAGQHATKLNVARAQLVAAIREVWESGRADAALAYRQRKGIDARPSVGVVIQTLVESHAAGVLFTRNPVTGANERVIEAAWGLGEVVVSGRIVPDYYRLSADGRLIQQVAGDKDVRIERHESGGTIDVPVSESLRRLPCLHPARLERLHALAEQCRKVWNHDLDLEFAFAHDDTLYLLQSRPITAARNSTA